MKTLFAFLIRLIVFPVTDFFTEKIQGKQNIPSQGSFIVAPNHINGRDHFFIGNTFKQRLKDLRFVGAMDSLKILLQSGVFYYLSDTIVINRKKINRQDTLNKLIKELKRDKIIIIYPEGDSNPKKQLLRGKTGVAELALKTGVPVIPVGIRKAKTPCKRIIKIGKPLYFPNFWRFNLQKLNQEEYHLLLRKTTDSIMREISKLSHKPYV